MINARISHLILLQGKWIHILIWIHLTHIGKKKAANNETLIAIPVAKKMRNDYAFFV